MPTFEENIIGAKLGNRHVFDLKVFRLNDDINAKSLQHIMKVRTAW